MRDADWHLPKTDEVRATVFAWLDDVNADEAVLAKAEALWPAETKDLTAGELLDLVTRVFALADDRTRQLVETCAGPPLNTVPPSYLWLKAPETADVLGNNLRLLYGRWLARERFYDEAREYLGGLQPGDVVDPASLLFYQSVVSHRLLDQESGLKTIELLLDGAENSPRRYESVARLMQSDLEDLKEDTLDHISRRMEDIERRLDLGRAGPRVREIEQGVIDSLDKLIKEVEEQQQQQEGAAANNVQSSAPAQDSRIMGGRGPGDVVKRNIGAESGWGNLPPKQRERALQQIGREFPAHYRDVVEQYFRKLAGEE
jgi:hypothetical protein